MRLIFVNKLIKGFNYWKHPIILTRKILHRLPFTHLRSELLGFPSKIDLSTEIEFLIKKNKSKRTVFLFPSPNCPWGYMFQRPQQLARALAKRGHIVIYMVDTSFPYSPDWKVRGIVEIEPNIFLYNDGNDNFPLEFLKEFNIVTWQYWPHQKELVEKFKNYRNVFHIFDCIDDISTFDSYKEITSDFMWSIKEADLVLATSSIIYDHVKPHSKSLILVPNGVEINDFSKELIQFPAISQISTQYNAIIGYYGAVADWFDFDLMQNLSENYPNLGFVIVGEIYEEVKIKANELKRNSNIFFIDRVSYELIPSILNYFDVGIIPFVVNDITLSTSPVKAYEYLAGGKEIVSTALPEVQAINLDFVAYSTLEFGQKIERALKSKGNLSRISHLKGIAEKSTWDERVTRVLENIVMKGDVTL